MTVHRLRPGGFLLHRVDLLTSLFKDASSGQLSASVHGIATVSFGVPRRTIFKPPKDRQSETQDISSRVPVSVEDASALAGVRPSGKCFLNSFAAVGTFLAGVSGGDKYNLPLIHFSVVNQEVSKLRPGGVRNAFCEMMVSYHIAHLQVF